MKLTESDSQYLLSIGYVEKDIPKIKKALRRTAYEIEERMTYEMERQPISREKVIKLIGRDKFLSGLARCAFRGINVEILPNEDYLVFNRR